MAENYLPLQLKGKPLQFQKDYISRYATPTYSAGIRSTADRSRNCMKMASG